jgi:hypothetical protein
VSAIIIRRFVPITAVSIRNKVSRRSDLCGYLATGAATVTIGVALKKNLPVSCAAEMDAHVADAAATITSTWRQTSCH